jgi:pimeloyl-ACP methyl ester carboxylesterase
VRMESTEGSQFSRQQLVLLAVALLVGLVVAGGGCANPLASVMVTPPNAINPLACESNCTPPIETFAGVDQQFFVPVGPPEASLSVSVIEPKNASGSAEPAPAKGTILVLHGIYARSLWMMGPARALANAGYRAVLVDLRGHGRSSGRYLTFGVQEAKDLSQVIDALAQRGLAEGPIGVYGISYGATCSIHLAGVDPRIAAVVAVAPFSTMRDEVPQFGKTMVPGVGWVIPEETYQRAIDEAGRLADFNPDRASAVEAIRKTKAQVLLVHGTNDWIVPHQHSLRLHEAAPDHSQLELIPWQGHMVIWFDPTSQVAEKTRDWFDRWLSK